MREKIVISKGDKVLILIQSPELIPKNSFADPTDDRLVGKVIEVRQDFILLEIDHPYYGWGNFTFQLHRGYEFIKICGNTHVQNWR